MNHEYNCTVLGNMEIKEAALKDIIRNKVMGELRSRFRSAMPYMGEIYTQVYKRGKNVSDISAPLMDVYESPKYSNPISILLVEGITASFPVDKVISYMRRHFGNLLKNIVRGTNDLTGDRNNTVHVLIEAEPNLIDKISRAMALCGYYLAIPLSEIHMGNDEWLQYEPRYDNSMTDCIKNSERYLLHLTPEIYTQKILKNGLVPRSKNSYLSYPERIYLLRGCTPYSEVENMCCMLSMVYNSKKEKPVWKYNVIIVDTLLLPDDLKIFEDPNFPVYGLYTIDNIPPKAIAGVKTFEIPDTVT